MESDKLIVAVGEAFVKKYLNGREAIGTTLHFHREKGETDADLPFTQAMTVVGVVENEVQGGDLGAPYNPMVYLDNLQLPASSLLTQVFTMAAQYAVRSSLSPEALAAELRTALHRDAPSMVEMNLQPMEVGIEKSLGQRRLALRLVAAFGGAALVLSAVGIYGVLAYSVARRRREIGIRMALGSTRPEAAALVMRQAGAMVLLGLLPGLVGAWGSGVCGAGISVWREAVGWRDTSDGRRRAVAGCGMCGECSRDTGGEGGPDGGFAGGVKIGQGYSI